VFRDAGDAPFSPEAFPELSAKACAILNTPAEECDPAILEQAFAVLAELLAALMAAEPARSDPRSALAVVRDRLNSAPGMRGNARGHHVAVPAS
jgi:hypothetical protein